MIIWSLKGPRCSLVLWGFLKTSSLHLKNSFWSPWKYRVHERSGGELWSGAGAAGSCTGEDTQGPFIFIMYSIRPSRQSAVFLEVRAPRLQIYSEPRLPSNKRGTKSNSPCIVSLLLSAFPSGLSLKITTGANTEKKDLQNSQFISHRTKTTTWMFTGTHCPKGSVMVERRQDVPH